MKVTIEFDMDNADFDNFAGQAIRQVLRQATDFILDSTDRAGILRDTNGNRIGQVTVTDWV